MSGIFHDGGSPRGVLGVNEIGGVQQIATVVTLIAPRPLKLAVRAGTDHVPIGQELLKDRRIELLHILFY